MFCKENVSDNAVQKFTFLCHYFLDNNVFVTQIVNSENCFVFQDVSK